MCKKAINNEAKFPLLITYWNGYETNEIRNLVKNELNSKGYYVKLTCVEVSDNPNYENELNRYNPGRIYTSRPSRTIPSHLNIEINFITNDA